MATRPESMMFEGGPKEYKQRAIQEANIAQGAIDRWHANNRSLASGRYQFKELIGKGSYGRVYKSIEKASGNTVAIKVLTPDDSDLNIPAEARDTNLQDALKEINILERLKQSGAVNVNQFIEAFTVHSQLWLVSEYCSGGSLSTLKRAAGGKLKERFIRAVARELAFGLASVHKAGIVHRDIKCANVMISESGGVQIIDFGVSAVLMSNMEEDKRKTIIGTPHWMAPELQQAPDKEVPHGSEVDVWAYGITLYECAMGYPPNATITQQARLRHVLRSQPPRLTDDKFSADLRDLVAFVLDPDPRARPTMQQVCEHPYLQGSESAFPTSSLQDLVETYYNWERSGGNRLSLWYAGGAAEAKFNQKPEQDEWVFSTTAAFDRMHGDEELSSSPPGELDDWEEDPTVTRTIRPEAGGSDMNKNLAWDRAEQDARARRGAKHLEGLFNQSLPPYDPTGRTATDLPLRPDNSGSSTHTRELSVGSTDDGTNIVLDPVDRKKRATMAWKWNDNLPKSEAQITQKPVITAQGGFSLGEPVTARVDNRQTMNLDDLMGGGPSRDSVRKTIDMDALMGSPPVQGHNPRETLDMDALFASPSAMTHNNRETMDMDALLASPPIAGHNNRETLDIDALLSSPPIQNRHSARDTMDMDALLNSGIDTSSQAAALPPVPPIPADLPSHAQRPSFQDPRKTLDLDELWAGTPQQLGDPLTFSPPPNTEQTMRPISHYQHQPYQGTDFAAVQNQQQRHPYNVTSHPSQTTVQGAPSQARPPTFDFESFAANGVDLDAIMAGEHDYHEDTRNTPVTDDDVSSLASHDFSSLNISAAHSRNQSGAGSVGISVSGLASSPPASPFGTMLPEHHRAISRGGLPPVPQFPEPVNQAALRDGADKGLLIDEMRRLLVYLGSVQDVALAYLSEADRRVGHGHGGADDADTESLHESIMEHDDHDGANGEDEGLEMRHR